MFLNKLLDYFIFFVHTKVAFSKDNGNKYFLDFNFFFFIILRHFISYTLCTLFLKVPIKNKPHDQGNKAEDSGAVVLCSSGHAGEGICASHRVLSRLHDLRNRADSSEEPSGEDAGGRFEIIIVSMKNIIVCYVLRTRSSSTKTPR